MAGLEGDLRALVRRVLKWYMVHVYNTTKTAKQKETKANHCQDNLSVQSSIVYLQCSYKRFTSALSDHSIQT